MPNSDLIRSVLKALDVLRLLSASGRPLMLHEIVEKTELKKPACCNLLRTLCARGYAEKTASGAYRLGHAPEELVREARKHTFQQNGETLLRTVAGFLPEATLTLSELTSDEVLCRMRMSPDRPGEIQTPEHTVFRIYSSVTALCLQALADNAESFAARFPFEEYGASGYPSYAVFRAEQKQIRKDFCIVRKPEGVGITGAFFLGGRFALGVHVRSRSIPLKRIQTLTERIRENGTWL